MAVYRADELPDLALPGRKPNVSLKGEHRTFLKGRKLPGLTLAV
jgi:hypothetical protein